MKRFFPFVLFSILMAVVAFSTPDIAMAQIDQSSDDCKYCVQHSTSGTNQFSCNGAHGNMKCSGTVLGGAMCRSCDSEVTSLPESLRVGPDGFLLEEPRVTALLREDEASVGEFISATWRWVVRNPCNNAIVAQVSAKTVHARLLVVAPALFAQ